VAAGPGLAALASTLVASAASLNTALDHWDGRAPLPGAVARPALAQQVAERRLSRDPALAERVLARLPAGLARDVRSDVLSHRELARLTPALPVRAFRIGPALPPATLLRFYREARRRSGVSWHVLAALNYVESDFGRLREASVAGAQGPMQFMPSTWTTYGRGDIHDPRQSILAAARFLRAAGWPDARRALYRYNPSWAYVDAVQRYAGRIRRDPRMLRAYWARQVIVRTPSGDRRLTSYGLR
jgi:membrane-bound lytic murein transglycosylase B